jgi:flavin reductase (DIM6/NTAB) family NADH-FMN oxidoreductase RutF
MAGQGQNTAERRVNPVGPDEFRKTLGHFPSGVTIVTVKVGGQIHGMTASAFCSVSLHPPLVAVSIDQSTLMHRHLKKSRAFGISILASDQDFLSDHFGGRPCDDISFRFIEVKGHSLVDNALAHLGCALEGQFDTGDHTMYVGRVEYVSHSENEEPLVHYAGKYCGLADPTRSYPRGRKRPKRRAHTPK